MAHSLEARVPFLDPVVTNFAFSLPRAAQGARPLEEGAAAQGGRAARCRARSCTARKRGFSIPAAAWLRGELEPFARETLSPETLRRQGFFAARGGRRGCSTTTSPAREDLSRQLWGLLAFTLWYERHVERSRRAALGADGGARRDEGLDRHDGAAHVLVFRPLIAILRGRGDEVEITARDYAQTLQLLELHGMRPTVIGHHGGRSRLGKARADDARACSALRRWAKGRDFDVALAHGSHELTMTARRLGIPSSTTFDYEFAWLQHQLGCRAATRVVVPEAIPPERLAPLRRAAAEARRSTRA